MKCWIVSYRWLDLPPLGNIGKGTCNEFYWSEAEAVQAVNVLAENERKEKYLDPSSAGQFEIVINVFTFEGQLTRLVV